MFLGSSKELGGLCPEYSLNVDSVTVTTLPEGASDPGPVGCTPRKVNGLVVHVEPCSSSNPEGLTTWVVPALGVEAEAIQRNGTSAGKDSTTVVGRALHTLRQATAKAVIGSSPSGWPTYTYRAAAISVPSSWAVRRDQNCPDQSAEGTLELGLPQVSSTCTALVVPTAGVTVSALTPGTAYASCSRFDINGLRAFVADCQTRQSDGVTSWAFPSLGVEVTGSGAVSARSTALVSLILHTVRRATPLEITDSLPLSLGIALEHTRVMAGLPIKGTAIFTNRTGTPITVETCAADGWLNVGLANPDITYSPSSPLIACAPSVQLASGVTRMPITVMTTYQGCSESGSGSAEYPPCNPGNQLPPLPPGTYHTVVITRGLPAGLPAPGVVRVTLTHHSSLGGPGA